MADSYTAEDITWVTRRLDIAMSRLMVAVARAMGVTVPELLALEHLDAEGGLGPSDLSRRLQMTTGAVTALVDRLEASGNAVRAPHPSDRRRVVVVRTAKADAELAEEVAPLVGEILELAKSLGDEERRVVGRFLERFIAIVERTASEACTT